MYMLSCRRQGQNPPCSLGKDAFKMKKTKMMKMVHSDNQNDLSDHDDPDDKAD